MRTKNAKRLWPVPATLAVVAVAALLAFGLIATNGAQPAAAQDADCTVTIMAGGDATTTDGVEIAITEVTCDANGDTATIKLVGPATRPAANAGPIAVYVLAEDDDGSEDIYPDGTFWQAVDATNGPRERGTFYDAQTGTVEEMATSYAGQNVTVPRAVQQGTAYVAQSTIVTVQGEGTVHIYLPDEFDSAITGNVGCTNETSAICDTDDPSPPSSAKMFVPGAPVNDTATVTIRFLGAPALGKDLDTDFNDDLDDEMMDQCVLTADVNDADAELLGEADSGNCGTHPDAPSDENWLVSEVIEDAAESRSKLVVSTSLEDVASNDPNPLIDGTTLTHMMDDEDAVTIYAVIQDAEGQPVEDTEVSFSSTTTPSGIVPARDLMDEGDAETLDGDVAISLGLVATDVVVAYELTGLAKEKGPYSIEVEVMAGDLNLGTVTITRADAPEKIVAGVFNAACFPPGGTAEEPDYEEAFNAKNKGCDASGMASRFGAGEMIFVKAHLEDSLDNVVGESDNLDSELADEFDDPLIDGDPVEIENPVSGKTMPKAWIYTIDEDAQLGDHMITVSTSAENADEEDIDDVTLTVTVAGPPAEFEIGGPDRIALGRSGEFMVTATDAIDGVPHFTSDSDDPADDNDTISVFIQGLTAGNVRNLPADGNLKLDTDTGTGTFTIYAPNGAMNGDTVRIFVGSGDMEQSHEVMFGMNRYPMGADIADVMMTMGDDPMMVEAMFTDVDGQDLTYEWSSGDEMVATVMADDMDMSMASITAVGAGEATITVTATDSEGGEGMQTFMVTVEEANVAPMAGDDIDPVMMTVGDDPMMVATMFTDANMDDMLTYEWTSDDEMVATVMADAMDMSMASITAVGAGEATITVTATDMDGASAEQMFMVTVAANMPPMGGDAIEVMMTMGDDPMMVPTMFTDAEDDMLTYSEMSSDEMVATAMVDMDGMVTITAVGAGDATITVTATDTQSGMGTQEIMVTVAANMPPMGGDAIEVMMTMGDDPMMVPTMFTDAEDDMLTYSEMSSDDMVATAMVDMDGMVTITAVGAGDATITVTATDTQSGMGTQEIMVTVAANMPPMGGDAIEVMMTMGDDPMMVPTMFTDAEDDMLTYSEMSSDDMVATAMVDMDGMVTITAVGAGDATITVTATDTQSGMGTQEIMVTVAANMPPMGGDAIEVMMTMGDDPMMVPTMFTDAEDDMLTYSEMSSDEMVATAMVDMDGMVTITAMGAGMATITVTATDTQGGIGTQEIMVSVMMMPPMELGAAMDLTATANDDGSITLMWTRGDNATHHFVSGNSAAVWEFAGGMSSHTVSIDKLVSGTEYTFYVISGRFMEADDGTWPGEWSSAGWTNAAKVTVQ